MADTSIPSELRYTNEHEWISTSAPWRIGVSDYAQNALGDLTYVELPSVGDTFEKGEEFGTLESTKSVSPLYMPVTGTVKAVNEALKDTIGFDMTDVMRSQTLEAKTTRNINVEGLPQNLPAVPASEEKTETTTDSTAS